MFIQPLLDVLAEKYYVEFADNYAEPGYADSDKGVLIGNWNEIPEKWSAFLERRGYDLEWSDEWIVAHVNLDGCSLSLAIRTKPDSYSWEPSFIATSNEIVTRVELEDNIDAIECVIESYINDSNTAVPSWLDLDSIGFTKVDSGVWGWDYNDDTDEIMSQIQEGSNVDVVFQVTSTGQFKVNFSVYTRSGDYPHEQ